ncbi:hypothetical protein ACFL25_01205 [Patescibacteria group bacterium]
MRKIRVLILVIIAVCFVLLTFYLFQNTKFKEISCKSQFGECSLAIKEKLKNIEDCTYFECRKNIDNVLSNAIIVDRYSYQIKFPLTFVVSLIVKKPKYSINKDSGGLIAQVDSTGLVMNYQETTSLPGVSINSSLPKLGETVSKEILFASELVYGISKIQKVNLAQIESNFLNVDLEDGKKVLLPLTGDRDFILGALTLILNELKKDNISSKIEKERIKEIDLRFKNPILK